ncbi:MAG: hypothetical protein ACXIVQ_05505 [Acidimicrobiales bacterium]
MHRSFVALAMALVLVLAACGDDDVDAASDEPAEETTTTTAVVDGEVDDTDEPEPTTTSTTTAPVDDRPAFEGGYEVDYETGEVDVSAYAAFLAEHGGPSGGAYDAALEMLADQYSEEEGDEAQDPPAISSFLADGGREVVSVTFDGLLDDSVAAVRFELVFIGDGEDLIIESASWASRCQPGRGHQEFSTGLCV